MPVQDGFDVLDWVRKNDRFHDIPVLMLTTSEASGERQRAQSLGVTQFLFKDGIYHKVAEVLETLIAETHLRHALTSFKAA